MKRSFECPNCGSTDTETADQRIPKAGFRAGSPPYEGYTVVVCNDCYAEIDIEWEGHAEHVEVPEEIPGES